MRWIADAAFECEGVRDNMNQSSGRKVVIVVKKKKKK
jgi:hypothetical protein